MNTVEYELMYQVEEAHWWYRALRRVLFSNLDRYLPDWREMPLLDAGCGTGANLSRYGAQAVGIDYSEEALRYCRERGLSGLVRADVSALPFVDGAFAAVVSTHVLYHAWVQDVRRALGELHRVLRDGGLLFLELPAYDALYSSHDDAVMTARRFTAAGVRRDLEAVGFRIRRLTYWNSLLLPPIWLVRRVFRSSGNQSDFKDGAPPAWPVNTALDLTMRVEFALSRIVSMPAGVAVSCVAERI